MNSVAAIFFVVVGCTTYVSGADPWRWQPLNLSSVCPPDATSAECSPFAQQYLDLLADLFGDSLDGRIERLVRRSGEDSEQSEEEEYDFIVVGAGAAGCVVANRLSAITNWKILLLEAGGEQPDVTNIPALFFALQGSSLDWKFHTRGNGKSCLAKGLTSCDWPIGKGMGGSSSVNAMVYVRGNRLDYDTWAKLGNVGWSYDDVLPYFKKSERNMEAEALDQMYHGANGEQYISRFPYVDGPSHMMEEAFNERGLLTTDFNGVHQSGVQQAQAVATGGRRVSTNNAFIQPIRWRRQNLVVKTNSLAVKILFDKKKRAYGVQYEDATGLHTAKARKEVIVSAGVVNSPKLLMLSGVGPKKHLQECGIRVVKDLAVGQNLHDHVAYNGIVVALDKSETTVDNEEMLNEILDYATAPRKVGPMAANGPISTVAILKTDPHLPAPDIQYQVVNTRWEEFVSDPIALGRINILPSTSYNGLIARVMNTTPKSRGYILLNTTNPHAQPEIYPNYLGEDIDLIPLIKGTKFFIGLENTEAFKSRKASFVKTPLPACKDYEWGTDEYIICLAKQYTSTTSHPGGTCKMGPHSDRKAVVDPTLKVYGVKKLRVIDASVMPTVPRSNTNAPSIMIGERGVAFVLEDWMYK